MQDLGQLRRSRRIGWPEREAAQRCRRAQPRRAQSFAAARTCLVVADHQLRDGGPAPRSNAL